MEKRGEMERSDGGQLEDTWTYRQGLQPLFVELSLLTRHPEGEAGEGRGERKENER